MNGIEIHQIYYRDDQKEYLDGGFSPWDNRKNPRPEWAELYVMRKAFRGPFRRPAGLTGFVSWKFGSKTGLSSGDVLNFITAHPGGDCYIFNPLTLQTALFASVWDQGEHWHPHIRGHGGHVLAACGVGADLESYVDGFATTAYCNYLVGSPRFWKVYLSLMKRVMTVLERHRREPVGPWQETLHDHRGYHFVPFLVERFFGVVARLHPDLKIIPYRYPDKQQAERTPGFEGLIGRAEDCKARCRDDRSSPAFREYLAVQEEIEQLLRNSPERDKLLLR